MPRRIRSRSIASELQAGPTVQIILARRTLEAGSNGSTGESARFGEGFPFFNFGPFKICLGPSIVYGEKARGRWARARMVVSILFSRVPVQASLGREFYRLNEFAEYEDPRRFKTCAT